MAHENRSNFQLVVRTITPSPTSIVGSLAIITFLVGFHLLILSNRPELFLPHVAGESNDQLARVYQANILGPLDSVFGSNFLGIVSTALIWGLTGWVVYSLIDFAVDSYREWKRSDSDITHPGKDQYVKRPSHEQTVIRIFWRFLVGIVAICVIIALQMIAPNLLRHDIWFLQADSWFQMVWHLAIVVIGWLLVFHVFVVLLRFFVFRTRVFGEIIR